MNCRHQGYSLIEMLVAISIMAVVMSIFGRVMLSSVTIQGDVHDAAWSNDRLSAVLSQVRADVWSARSVSLDEAGVLTVIGAEDARIRWIVGQDTHDGDTRWFLTRAADQTDHDFQLPELERSPVWMASGSGRVTLRLDEAQWAFGSEYVRLLSKERP